MYRYPAYGNHPGPPMAGMYPRARQDPLEEACCGTGDAYGGAYDGYGQSAMGWSGQGRGSYRMRPQNFVDYEYVGRGMGDYDPDPMICGCPGNSTTFLCCLPFGLLLLGAVLHLLFPALRWEALIAVVVILTLVFSILGCQQFYTQPFAGQYGAGQYGAGQYGYGPYQGGSTTSCMFVVIILITVIVPILYFFSHPSSCCTEPVPACEACRAGETLQEFCSTRVGYESCPYLGQCLASGREFQQDERQFCCQNFRLLCMHLAAGHIHEGIRNAVNNIGNGDHLDRIREHFHNAGQHISNLHNHLKSNGHYDRFGNWVQDGASALGGAASAAGNAVVDTHNDLAKNGHYDAFGNWVADTAKAAGAGVTDALNR